MKIEYIFLSYNVALHSESSKIASCDKSPEKKESIVVGSVSVVFFVEILIEFQIPVGRSEQVLSLSPRKKDDNVSENTQHTKI